ncbi:MAG: peptidylprolyl isomerase [Candidatus Margulisiibacteriota bacterium]
MLTFLRKKMRVIMIAVAIVFAASMFYGISMSRSFEGGKKATKGLAKINGREIDSSRYTEMLNRIGRQFGTNLQPQDIAFIQNLALGQTIDFMLILDEAKKKVRVSGQEVEAAVNNMMKQEKIPSQKDLENSLKRMGLTLGTFKKMVRDEMLVQKMMSKVKGEAKTTPDDLREISASHILVSQESSAKEILQKIKKGGDFSSLAKEYSIDQGSAVKGGDLGYFTTGMMVEPFEKAAYSLKIGEVSGVVKSDFGYHIIKLADSRLRKFPGDEKDIDKAALTEKQDKAFQKWFVVLKNNAKIEVINPTLKAHDLRFSGKIGEAINAYQGAIALAPADPALHVFLGDTYNMVGKGELALAEYEKAVKLEGGNPTLYMILARAYEAAGKKDLAVKQYKLASIVAGDNKALHEQLLKKFKELKVWDESEREKEEIARIEKKEKFEKELKGE